MKPSPSPASSLAGSPPARRIGIGSATAGLTAVVLWGAWFPVTKLAVSRSLDEIDLAFLRFSTAGVIALPILARAGFRVRAAHGLLKALLLAFCAGIGYILIAALALRFAPGSYGMVTPVSVTTFSALLAMAFARNKRNRFTYASIAMNVIGVTCLIALSRDGSSVAGRAAIGIALFVIAGLVFSLYNFFVARWKVGPMHATALVSFFSAVVIVPIQLAMGSTSTLAHLPLSETLFHMGYQGILVSYVALVLFTAAVQKLGSDKAAYLVLAVPAVAVVLSIVLLGERVGVAVLLPIGLLLVGMGLGIHGSRRPAAA